MIMRIEVKHWQTWYPECDVRLSSIILGWHERARQQRVHVVVKKKKKIKKKKKGYTRVQGSEKGERKVEAWNI